MKNPMIAIVFLFVYSSSALSLDVFRVISENCLNENSARIQSGFSLHDDDLVITALHGVADCQSFRAELFRDQELIKIIDKLKITHTDVRRDIAVLSKTNLSKPSIPKRSSPKSGASLGIVGFPKGVSLPEPKPLSVGEIKPLRSILDPIDEKRFEAVSSPALNIQVITLDGNAQKGYSGAPILDKGGNVLGVLIGGHNSGEFGTSWAIPISDIDLDTFNENNIRNIVLMNQRFSISHPPNFKAQDSPPQSFGALKWEIELQDASSETKSFGPASIAVAPNSPYIAIGQRSIGDSDTWNVSIVEAISGVEVLKLRTGRTGPIDNLTFSPNGKFLVASQIDRISIWHFLSGDEPIVDFKVEEWVKDIAISSDSRYLAYVLENSDVCVRQLTVPGSERCFRHMLTEPYSVGGISRTMGEPVEVAFSTVSPTLLYTGSRAGTLRIWNLNDSKKPKFVFDLGSSIWELLPTSNGSEMIVGAVNGIHRWNLESNLINKVDNDGFSFLRPVNLWIDKSGRMLIFRELSKSSISAILLDLWNNFSHKLSDWKVRCGTLAVAGDGAFVVQGCNKALVRLNLINSN